MLYTAASSEELNPTSRLSFSAGVIFSRMVFSSPGAIFVPQPPPEEYSKREGSLSILLTTFP